MNAPETYSFPPTAASRSEASQLGALVDVTLLFMTMVASSDMLTMLGPVQVLFWLSCYGLCLLRIGVRLNAFLAALFSTPAVLIYPATCLISVLWSASPKDTLVSGVQLTMTVVIAAYLGWRYSLRAILRAAFVVLTIAVLLSLLHWATGIFPWSPYSRTGGLVGVFSQKNMLGQRALFLIVICLTLMMSAQRPGSAAPHGTRAGLHWYLFSFGLAMLALVLSRSITSVALLLPLLGILLVLGYRHVPRAALGVIAAVLFLSVSIGPVALAVQGTNPVQAALDATGKDATLTGRTQVWDVGQDMVQAHPILGVGFNAFSKAPAFTNKRLLMVEAGIVTAGASFHNFVLEILVGTGIPGLLAMSVLLGATGWQLVALYRGGRSIVAAGGFVLLLGACGASLFGPSLYRQHEFMITMVVLLLFGARGDLSRLRSARQGPPPAQMKIAEQLSETDR